MTRRLAVAAPPPPLSRSPSPAVAGEVARPIALKTSRARGGGGPQRGGGGTAARMAFAIALLTPTLALAHPGDHSTMTFAQGMRHLFTEPTTWR